MVSMYCVNLRETAFFLIFVIMINLCIFIDYFAMGLLDGLPYN